MGTEPSDAGRGEGQEFGPASESHSQQVAGSIDGTHLGGIQVVLPTPPDTQSDAPVPFYVDYYVGTDGHTHVVVSVEHEGVLEILSDTVIPYP